jgi:type IV pilus assembly protein PilQ
MRDLRINLDFKNTDLKDIIRLIANQYGLNIFIAEDVSKFITLHLANISVTEALNFICKENSLSIQRFGSIYKISNIVSNDSSSVPNQSINIVFIDSLLSADFENQDVRRVFHQISKLTNETIFLDDNVSGLISGYFHNLSVEKALYYLAKNNGYHIIHEDVIYQIQKNYLLDPDQSLHSTDFFLHVHNNLIDLEVVNGQITILLNDLFRQLGLNLFLIGDLKGTVSALAYNLNLDECLNLILSSNDYTFKKMGNHYLVGSKTDQNLLASLLIPLNYIKVDNILDMLPAIMIEKAEIKIIKEHNAVLIHSSQDVLSEIKRTILDLDRPIPQILIEALVVDYNYQDIKEISVEGGLSGGMVDSTKGAGDHWFPALDIYLSGENVNHYLDKIEGYFGISNIGKLPDDFYLKVKALETIGKANIRSKPQIATLNGYPADITIGQTQYYILTTQTPSRDPSQLYIQETQQFHTIEANITLKITPWVSSAGEITVEIHPEFNNPVGQFSSEVPPTIQRRALNSTVRLQDGETIVLGGLIQTSESVSKFQLPILGSLPLIGQLFQSTNHRNVKSELIIYITPHLSYSGNPTWVE